MALETHTEVIQASPAIIFTYLADVSRHLEWSGSVEHGLDQIEVLTPGPVGMGTRWRSAGRNYTGQLNRDESTVTEFEPPRRFGFVTRFELNGAKMTFHHRYDLTSQNGGTRVVYSMVSIKPRNLNALLLLLSLTTTKRTTAKRVIGSGVEALKLSIERLPEAKA
jgi:uncharacterized protein YndB with AHSA1/START domain